MKKLLKNILNIVEYQHHAVKRKNKTDYFVSMIVGKVIIIFGRYKIYLPYNHPKEVIIWSNAIDEKQN